MKHSEHILVVPRVALVAAGIPVAHSLLGVDQAAQVCGNLEQLVATAGLFLPRYAMEQDPTYKQIIPYMVFLYEWQIFVMQRSAQAGEQRLASAYTVGIGGHVRAGDLGPGGLSAWGKREFMEEVSYEGAFASITCVGVVNDERNQVGMVHLGAVYALHATSGAIAIRSELASGVLMDREACLAHYDAMETWSQQVVDALIQHNYI
jgi:predicted NUDIX family phosphoesterase